MTLEAKEYISSLSGPKDLSSKTKENLASVIEKVLAILESNPKLKESFKEDFWKMFEGVTHSPEKLDALLASIDKRMFGELSALDKESIPDAEKLQKWKQIIQNYTVCAITACKSSLT
jgi:hypothetical protein